MPNGTLHTFLLTHARYESDFEEYYESDYESDTDSEKSVFELSRVVGNYQAVLNSNYAVRAAGSRAGSCSHTVNQT